MHDGAWEEEASCEDLHALQAWQAVRAVEIESPFYAMRAEIRRIYEEMFMVRYWMSLGGFLTHYRDTEHTPEGLEPWLVKIAEWAGVPVSEFCRILNAFQADYLSVAYDINRIINLNGGPEVTPELASFHARIVAIREHPEYQILFRSHFLQRYLDGL